MSKLRAAFVTIGQTPRNDILPEMLDEISLGMPEGALEVAQFGVLDGLESDGLTKMAAQPGEASFATLLRDGTEMVTSKEKTEARLNEILAEIDGLDFDLIVLLCTGTRIDPLKNTLVIEAQRLVDATVAALATSCRRLGVMVPLQRQVAEFAQRHVFPGDPLVAAASPYDGGDFGAAARSLRECDLIVMHCMGYDAAMLAKVREGVSAPVLLSRRVVAGVIRQMI